MNCPNCQQPTTAAQEQCLRCAALLLTLSPGTRLHHRFMVTRAVSRHGVVTYEATDEQDGGQTVTLLEYLPAGSRRMGALVILDANGQTGREFWTTRMERWQAVATPTLQQITDLFEQHGTTYAVLPHSSDQAAPPLALQGQQVEPLLRGLLPALQALHAEGAAGPFQVTAVPPRLIPDPQTNWPAELTPPEGQGGQLPTPATDLYARAGLIHRSQWCSRCPHQPSGSWAALSPRCLQAYRPPFRGSSRRASPWMRASGSRRPSSSSPSWPRARRLQRLRRRPAGRARPTAPGSPTSS